MRRTKRLRDKRNYGKQARSVWESCEDRAQRRIETGLVGWRGAGEFDGRAALTKHQAGYPKRPAPIILSGKPGWRNRRFLLLTSPAPVPPATATAANHRPIQIFQRQPPSCPAGLAGQVPLIRFCLLHGHSEVIGGSPGSGRIPAPLNSSLAAYVCTYVTLIRYLGVLGRYIYVGISAITCHVPAWCPPIYICSTAHYHHLLPRNVSSDVIKRCCLCSPGTSVRAPGFVTRASVGHEDAPADGTATSTCT